MAATANVTFAYDAAGHRTRMTDGLGATDYHYDDKGRMDWEERTFAGVGAFRLSYGYNAGGELTSVTNPWNAQVTYAYDTAGRLSGVGGAGYLGVSTYAGSLSYRAFGALKGMSYANGRAFSAAYDTRMRPTNWNVSGVLGYEYNYDYFNERTGRVSYARSLYDPSLDRSYEYDNVGRLTIAHAGAEARAAVGQGAWGVMDGPYSQGYDYDAWGNLLHRYGWGGEVQGGGAGQSSDRFYTYSNNRRTDSGFTYDASGNLTFDGGQHFTYDAAGRQTSSDWTQLQQGYDGDGLRVRKSDESTAGVYYLRSSVLGGQVVAEIGPSGNWQRGYVYAGSSLLAVQQGGVYFVHEDPVTKSKRVTDVAGSVVSAVELDPFGADTTRSGNAAFQPKKFTSYERDYNGSDEAMFRRYNRWHARFDQPDPYGGSYDLADPQSFNRYSYTQNDPVNFTDPTGLMWNAWDSWEDVSNGFWGLGSLMNRSRSLGPDDLFVDAPPGFVSIVEADFWTFHTLIKGELVPRVGNFHSVLIGWDWAWTGFYAQEKPHLERYFSHNPEGYDAWNRYMLECAKEKGIEIATHATLLGAGQPLLSKPRHFHGASGATSLASKIGSLIDVHIPQSILPRGIWAPTLNNLSARTRHLGRAVGRAVPWAAAAHLGKDFIDVLQCANEKFKQNHGR